jgi:hypothetical protein
MTTITQLKKVQTLEDLQTLRIGRVIYECGGRGGYCGFYATSIAEHFGVNEHELPNKFGCYVNYLGGGLRGSVTQSEYHNVKTSVRKSKLLAALAAACVRVYNDMEGSMNDEEDDDGDINWEAKGTNAARAAGIVSAY